MQACLFDYQAITVENKLACKLMLSEEVIMKSDENDTERERDSSRPSRRRESMPPRNPFLLKRGSREVFSNLSEVRLGKTG